MAAIAGRRGNVKVGANTVAEVKEWSLEIEMEPIDTSAMGDDWADFIVGLKNWSATLTCNHDITDVNGQRALYDAMINSTVVVVKLLTDAASNYSGSAYVVGWNPTTPADDAVEVEIELQGYGTLTLSAS